MILYDRLKALALRVMKTPEGVPDPPAGSHDSIQIFRASPRFLSYRMLGFWVLFAVLWIAALVVLIAGLAAGQPAGIVAGILLLLALLPIQFLAYFAIRIDYEMRYYIVTDRSLRVRQGAVTVKEMTITHANVQNLRVVQGPFLQLFGVSNLEVDTAGGGGANAHGQPGGGHAIQMAGIENAQEVRDLILRHLRSHGGGAGLGDMEDDQRRAGELSAPALAALRLVRDSSALLRQAAEAL